MVAKARDYVLNLPPATWISIILIIVAGVSAFTAVRINAGDNAARIQAIQIEIEKTELAHKAELLLAKSKCDEMYNRLTKEFRDHCAWGAKSKAAQDQEQAVIKIQLKHVIEEQKEMKLDVKEILNRMRNGNAGPNPSGP